MNCKTKESIVCYEERLKIAMLQSDVNALEQLLAPDLVFTNHLGQVISKNDDIESHKSGELTIDRLDLSEQRIQSFGDVVSVSVRTKMIGLYKASPVSGDFRFTRIWCPATPASAQECAQWQVVVAHSSLLA